MLPHAQAAHTKQRGGCSVQKHASSMDATLHALTALLWLLVCTRRLAYRTVAPNHAWLASAKYSSAFSIM
jgi:hypothetical protein